MDEALLKKLANAYLLALAAEPHGCPSGHLYAMVAMSLGASLDEHNTAVAIIKRAGLANEENYLLTWAGPLPLRTELIKAMQN